MAAPTGNTWDGKVAVQLDTATTPTALLHLGAGGTAAGTAPFKFVSGTLMSTPEDGVFEYDGTDLWFTIGSTRYKIDTAITTAETITPTESLTGKTWLGKNVYRKCFTGSLPNAGTAYISLASTTWADIIRLYGTAYRASGPNYLQLGTSDNSSDFVFLAVNTNQIQISDAYNYSAYSYIIIMEYTKVP